MNDNTSHFRKLEKVLRRISIPRGQVTLLKALYEAEGKFVPRRELIERIRWGDSKSFTGVLAAFAGRINHTESFEDEKPGYEAFIEVKEVDGEESWQLRNNLGPPPRPRNCDKSPPSGRITPEP